MLYREKQEFIEIFCRKIYLFCASLYNGIHLQCKNSTKYEKRELIFFAAFATFLSANAQEKQTWSLDDCINYALEKTSSCSRTRFPYRKAKWM